MAKTHTTRHNDGNGHVTETKVTTYDSGATKAVTTDISETTLVSVDPVISVTRTDEEGNSHTTRYR